MNTKNNNISEHSNNATDKRDLFKGLIKRLDSNQRKELITRLKLLASEK